jgi:heme-degrading monooxygenase HmoA
MLCALTVRTLKPGTFEPFREAFMRHENLNDPPPGFVRFSMVRNADRPEEVICFGFFDGDVDELRRTAAEQGYAEQLDAISPFVESIGADGLYEVIEDHAFRGPSLARER